ISDAAYAGKKTRVGGRRLDLLPQIGDLVVDDPLGDGCVPTPGFVDQHAARQHATGARDEDRQQLEFERRHRDRLSSAAQLPAGEAQLPLAELRDLRPALHSAAQQYANPGAELFGTVRLRDVIVGAEVESQHLVALAAARGQQQDGGDDSATFEFATDVEAV